MEERILPGLAADDSSAVRYLDETLVRVVRSRQEAQVYRVYASEGQVVEEKLEMVNLD